MSELIITERRVQREKDEEKAMVEEVLRHYSAAAGSERSRSGSLGGSRNSAGMSGGGSMRGSTNNAFSGWW